MRVTSFPLATLRDTPSEAEITSHQLLLKGGFIKRVSSGIYAYMPLMLRVIEKISLIIDKELNKIGCSKLLLPQLHPSELWKKSGRWEGYTEGEGIMFNLKDRQDRSFGLAPTHEEVITYIASEIVKSYKQLPFCFYQIQTKFRDEIRPRFGLMRGREFIMKDGYSFHSSKEDLIDFYKIMEKSYEKIFENCGLNTLGVEADSGAIGGGASKEFMVTANSGEDSILFTESGSYSANIEKAISLPSKEKPLNNFSKSLIHTPNQKSIKDICKVNNIDPSQIVKVIIYKAKFEDKSEVPLLVCIRGDQTINDVKVFNLIDKTKTSNLITLSLIESDLEIKKNLNELPLGFIGPDLEDQLIKKNSFWEKKWVRIVDHSAHNLSKFISGANKVDFHKIFNSWKFIGDSYIKADIRNSKAGDYLDKDSSEILLEAKGIEIGHIFQLGQKYSKKLDAKFSNQNGLLENIWMGCYGIGVSRLAQAAIEQNHDKNGICWPIQISPFQVVLIATNFKDPIQKKLALSIYKEMQENNIDVLFDDRDERAGIKFKDADLIGFPFRVIVGRDAVDNQVELISRSKEIQLKLSSKELIEKFLNESKLM